MRPPATGRLLVLSDLLKPPPPCARLCPPQVQAFFCILFWASKRVWCLAGRDPPVLPFILEIQTPHACMWGLINLKREPILSSDEAPFSVSYTRNLNCEKHYFSTCFCQSARNFSRPMSVSGCLASCSMTLYGMVQMSAPIIPACRTCCGLRTEATMISVS